MSEWKVNIIFYAFNNFRSQVIPSSCTVTKATNNFITSTPVTVFIVKVTMVSCAIYSIGGMFLVNSGPMEKSLNLFAIRFSSSMIFFHCSGIYCKCDVASVYL